MGFKKHISFPDIGLFRHVVETINRRYNFLGLDELGDAIYDETRPKPVLTFDGTVKLHGTNFGICFNEEDGIWAQSRENIITPEHDNAGSAFFVEANKTVFMGFFHELIDRHQIDPKTHNLALYAEWVGKGIQSGVAITNLDKSAFIIGFKAVPHPTSTEDIPKGVWYDASFLKSPEHRIYNLMDFERFTIEIDFNEPSTSLGKLNELLEKVENECPVAKAFGFSGIGEGMVFTCRDTDGEVYRFKHKGDKHSKASKVKTLKPVDDEKMNKVITVANQVCKGWRLEQMLEKTCNFMNGGKQEMKQIGEFIKNVNQDVIKEESDVIAAAGLIPKDINSKVSEICRTYFIDKLNEAVGLK
jgi:hypothetical protein